MAERPSNGVPKHHAFDEAFDIYLAELQKKPKQKKLDFIYSLQDSEQKDGVQDIEGSINKLQKKCERKGQGTKTQKILKPVVDAIKDYSGVVDVMVSAHPMPAALIWGGIKVLVEFTSSYLDMCEALQKEIEALTVQVRRNTLYERLYKDFPEVQRALGRSYVDILEFWYQASKWCEKRTSRVRRALVAPAANVKIMKVVGQLTDDADLLEKVSKDAELDLEHKARGRQDNEAIEASKHRQRQNLRDQHDAAIQRMQLQIWLKDWLGGNNEFNSRQYDHLVGKRHSGSCNWLLHHNLFNSWWQGHIYPPILWLHAQPGAGKSVLCSFAIEKARKTPSEVATAFLFLRFARQVSPIQLLRDLALQLLLQLFQRLGRDQDIPESLYGIWHSDRDDSTYVKRLLEQLVDHLTPVYIFLDGLNEVEADIQDFLKFLNGMAANEKLRLWCSSQHTSKIKRDLEGCHELVISVIDTQSDIESYLATTIPQHVIEGDQQFITTFQDIVLDVAKGCFLWASNMIEELAAAVSEDEMKQLILERLPVTMDEYYKNLLERLNKRDNTPWRLVRTVLSLVTFTKRPLRMSELREAIAILRKPLSDNLSNSALPLEKKILEFCSPLIECIHPAANAGDGQVQLSHSLVRDFLLKHSDRPQDVSSPLGDSPSAQQTVSYVSSRVIAESCVRYLLQRKYSHLLNRRTPSRFDVTSSYDIADHHLLLYAAEFWFGHYDEVEPTMQDHKLVNTFLESLNFYACIQVQSLYVTLGSHRASSREKESETRRVLPKWLLELPTGRALESEYDEYIDEWGHLLRQGISWGTNGEIDRCFCGALGTHNFLSKARELERYASFMFMDESESTRSSSIQYSHAVSSDGTQLILAALDTEWYPDGLSTGKGTLRLELWPIDGENGPCLEQRRQIPQPPVDGLGSLYSPCNPSRFSITPEVLSKHRPAAVSFSENGCHLRVGSSVWSNRSNELSTAFDALKIDDGSTTSYWEEIASRHTTVVLARRRAQRRESKHLGGKNIVNLEDENPDHEPLEHRLDDLDSNSQCSGSMNDEVQSLFSNNSDTQKFSTEEHVSLSGGEDQPSKNDIAFSSGSDDDRDSDGQLNFSDDDGGQDGPVYYKSSDEGSESNSEQDSQNSESDPLEYAKQGPRFCNICRRLITVHYHCDPCGKYDICEPCFDEGEWCQDHEHSLTKRSYWNQQDGEVVSFDDLALLQELTVIDTQSTETRNSYYFSRKSEDIMFESPPVVHPEESLVIWLMSRDKLLFADFDRISESIHRLPPSNTKTQRISASLRISTCGRYLHIISFEAPIPTRRGTGKPLPGAKDSNGGLQALVCLLTYRLSKDKMAETPPTLIFSLRFSLSPLSQTSVITLPFAVTWKPTEAFISVSDSELRVYRVRLFQGSHDAHGMLLRRRTIILNPEQPDGHSHGLVSNSDDDNSSNKGHNTYVSVPKKSILLPQSAKDRTVQFFPPAGDDRSNSTLIIGSRPGLKSTPPIGIYLSEQDLGGWISMTEARRLEMESLTKLVQRLGGKFEDLVPGEDLDLVRIKTQDGYLESAGLEDTTLSVHFGQDLELTHGRNRVLMRRVDESDGRITFKTPTGAGTAVVKANEEDEVAKLNWYYDLSLPIEVQEYTEDF